MFSTISKKESYKNLNNAKFKINRGDKKIHLKKIKTVRNI